MKIFFLSLTLISLFFIACEEEKDKCVKGSGDLVKEEKILTGEFNSVDLEGVGNVYISYGKTKNLEVEAQSNVLSIITTKIENGVLKLNIKSCLDDFSEINFYLTLPDFEDLTLSGSGNFYIGENDFENKVFEKLDINLLGSGNFDLKDLQVNELSSNLNGSGNITISGKNNNKHNINLSGSGNFNCFFLITNICDINLSGSGNCNVFVSDELTGILSGSGNITYINYPNINDIEITGSGNIINGNK